MLPKEGNMPHLAGVLTAAINELEAMQAHGENSGKCKLTADQVIEIRRIAGSNPKWGWQSKLARELKVHNTTISEIKLNKHWRHI